MSTNDNLEDHRPRTNAELREEATSRMVQTAIRLIAERGASKLSLVDVGRESGYSHSLPNYYFKTKKGLLLHVCAFIIQDFSVRAKQWIKDHLTHRVRPGLDNIESSIRAYLGLAGSDSTRSRAMHVLWAESFSSTPELLEEVRPLNQQTLRFFEEQIRVGIQRGEIDQDVDPEALALVIVALIRGAVAQQLLDPDRVAMDRVTEAVTKLLRGGVLPGGGAR